MKPNVKHYRRLFSEQLRLGNIKAADNCDKCRRHRDEVYQLELHHKVPIKTVELDADFDPNVPDNIATLCHDCHKGLHVGYEHLRYDTWLSDVAIDEMYEKLRVYREEKEARRLMHAKRHKLNKRRNF